MNGWDIKEYFDEIVFESYNLYNFIHSIRYKNKIKNIELELNHNQCNLILNGPSSKDITIDTSLPCFFVNYGFNHQYFKQVKSPILIIIDTKLIRGEWDLSILMEALKVNQNVKFIFNYKYLTSKKFLSYVKKVNCLGYINNSRIPTRFNWKRKLEVGKFNFGVGVAEQALSLMGSLGYKKINTYGFDGNNVLLALTGKDTHFYGSDSTKDWSDPRFISRELRFLSYFVDRNYWLSKCLEYNNIKVKNYTSSKMTAMYNER